MQYSDKVQDYFLHPRNLGEIKNPDGFGKAGNMRCGDVMLITLKIEEGKIADIKFKTFGCAAAIATASVVTTLAKGKTLEGAEKIEFREVVEALDGLPQVKMHCSVLAITTLRAAIQNAYGEHKGDLTENTDDLDCAVDCSFTCHKCPKKSK